MKRKWWERLMAPATRTVRSKPQPAGRRRLLYLEQLEERLAPAQVNWINLAGGNWSTASNWRDDQGVNRTPTAGDNVVIPTLNSGASVTHSTGTDTVNSITSRDRKSTRLNSSH